MKKLIIVVLIAGLTGLAFAFTPALSTSNQEVNNTGMFTDSTKTKKKNTTTTKKEGCSKSNKSCCDKSKQCSDDKTKK
ncbi:MAG: hypothetical protein U0W24_09110 [Bacteroidales bacterium]